MQTRACDQQRETPVGFQKGASGLGAVAWVAVIGLLAQAAPGCRSPSPASEERNLLEGRAPGQFRVALLTAADAAIGMPARGECDPVVRGTLEIDPAMPPEVDMTAEVVVDGGTRFQSLTDADGTAALVDLPAGTHWLTLTTADGLLRVRLPILVDSRRADVRGYVALDAQDQDGDGVREELLALLEMLPDASQDGISDTGARMMASLGTSGGRLWMHGSDGTSESRVVDSDLVPGSGQAFADRDGDFIADPDDADSDGDGIPDAEEPQQIRCGPLDHDRLSVTGSQHESLSCGDCHLDAPEPALGCADCHTPTGRAWQGEPTTSPAGHFQRACDQCHRADQPWTERNGPQGNQHHDLFPLQGNHLSVRCLDCHAGGGLAPPNLCETCHSSVAVVGHFGSGCGACHTAGGWGQATHLHNGFPLVGKHSAVACEGCHVGGVYGALDTACTSCHTDTMPTGHNGAGFGGGQACDNCHSVEGFSPPNWEHRDWVLTGQHATQPCNACHPDSAGNGNGGNYGGLQTYCSFCHTAPAFPDHSDTATYSTDCEFCHITESWVPATRANVDHSFFPLTGSHGTALCGSCHAGGTLLNPPTNCTGCHSADRPTRHTGYFDGECSTCHQTTTWADLLTPYRHTATFPLDGAHTAATCAACHPTSYAASSSCSSCHAGDAPTGHYGNDCASCHTTSNWNPTGSMNHHTADPTAFPLSGAHANVLCSACHGATFGPLPRDCASCHDGDTPLGHATNSCASCHQATTWGATTSPPAGVLHPLDGRHVGQYCTECHGAYVGGGVFTTVHPSAVCASCHTLPGGHIAVGTSGCASCHTVDGWIPASGGHDGAVPSSPFPYSTWSGRWFPETHGRATECDQCHTTMSTNLRFYSCTTNCHRSASSLDDAHGNESLYHFSPTATHSPSNEGGGVWPTAHVGCVKSGCHADGRQ